ncbi:MAG: DUF4445 domain-containing protein [Ruminococcaceae bacterium]|nr:DUF4445 domain-containing protein [Oscillospiraceae bacterium]
MNNENKLLTIWQGDSCTRLRVTGQPMLLDVLREQGMALSAPCGGDGRCGRCLVRVKGGVSAPCDDEMDFPGVGRSDEDGFVTRLACRARLTGDCEVRLSAEISRHKLSSDGGQTAAFPNVPFAVAVDLGTTTIGLRAVDVSDGTVIAQACELNDQRVCGADVMTRIAYCARPDGVDTLHRLVSSQITRMILRMSGGCSPEIITVAGNTVMLHLLAGIDPSYLGKAPYRTAERFGQWYGAERLGLPADAWLLPCVGGYTGGDLTAALLALTSPRYGGKQEQDGLALCDLGTNGEMALMQDGRWLVTSSAAGPALEGGGISCGSGAVSGAVTAVSLSDDNARYALTSPEDDRVIPIELRTVNDAPPRSLTGAALVSLTALLLREGKILPNGRMIARYWQIDDRTEGQTDAPIRYTQADVRQLQLAKGAVAAAFRRLCEEAKCVSDEKCSMDCLHIDLHMTGGLGCHIPTSDALDIGLVCDMKSGMTVSFVPNLALEGAVLCLRKEQRQRAADIASRSRELELSGDGRFDELFVSCMRLGEPDDDY